MVPTANAEPNKLTLKIVIKTIFKNNLRNLTSINNLNLHYSHLLNIYFDSLPKIASIIIISINLEKPSKNII